MKFPSLEGGRIVLTELNDNGLDEMYEYSKNPLLYQYLEFKPQETKEETRAYLNKLLKRVEAGTAHYWFIRLKESNKIIGTFGVCDIDWRKRDADISYGLSPDYWGKGYFGEALSMVVDYLFGKLDFYRIHAITRFDNLPSINALRKSGFSIEGTLRHYYLNFKGERFDAVILSKLKPEHTLTRNSFQSNELKPKLA